MNPKLTSTITMLLEHEPQIKRIEYEIANLRKQIEDLQLYLSQQQQNPLNY